MLPSWCNDSVTRLRAPLVSARGTKERDWSAATQLTVRGCSLQVDAMGGELDDRESTAATARLFMPVGADVHAGDRISFDGATWSVVGEPYNARSAFGRTSHACARLKRWEG